METELKNRLQEKLELHFNTFSEVELNNSTFRVMPMQKDIPKLTRAVYDNSTDSLEILLDYSGNHEWREISTGIEFAFDKASNKLVGIKIKNFTKALAAALESLPKIKHQYQILHSNPLSYREVEKRKFEFFEDVLHEDRNYFMPA